MNVDSRTAAAALAAAREIAMRGDDLPVPVDIVGIAREAGVVSIDSRPMNIDGYLGRSPNGQLIIRYRAGNPWRRNRFTIAHEIGHLLIAKCDGREIVAPVGRTWDRNESEELLANRIAAELLMPERRLSSDLLRTGVGWQAVFSLCGQYEVSNSAMVARLLELQSIVAVLFRVDLECLNLPDGRRFSCRTSLGRRVQLLQPPSAAAESILTSRRRGLTHTIKVDADSRLFDVDLFSRLMDAGAKPQIWALGWTSNS